ncbi:hypothetical protein [Dactylosporangium sp. NPDC000521]|uniref:hypothetical protein n=1 Tax=Dactylosporangium sp. NPDC000521 TaxID=3363975 RepID=UPI00367BB5A0
MRRPVWTGVDAGSGNVVRMSDRTRQERALMSVRTAVIVLAGVLAGVAAGWLTGNARGSVPEGLLAGAAACAATVQFLHATIEPDRR